MSELIVALDFPDARPALELARRLSGHTQWVKVGLELFTASGPDILIKLRAIGFKVFLDLKMHDIPQTVRNATLVASRIGVDMITIHTIGGESMVRAAVECMEELNNGKQRPMIFGVTVLTSIGQGDMPGGFNSDLNSLALELATSAKKWGLDGIVCSGHEVEAIKRECGADFLCLTPGIRLKGNAQNDQKRVMTPREAVMAGSDYLVVGRSITMAIDPARIADNIVKDMIPE